MQHFFQCIVTLKMLKQTQNFSTTSQICYLNDTDIGRWIFFPARTLHQLISSLFLYKKSEASFSGLFLQLIIFVMQVEHKFCLISSRKYNLHEVIWYYLSTSLKYNVISKILSASQRKVLDFYTHIGRAATS